MSTLNKTCFVQILAVTGSCSTDVVHYLPSRTDDGSMGDDWMLNAWTVGDRLEMTEQRKMDVAMKDGCWTE